MSLSQKPDGYRKIGWTTGYICYRCGCLVTERAIHNRYHDAQRTMLGFTRGELAYSYRVLNDLFGEGK